MKQMRTPIIWMPIIRFESGFFLRAKNIRFPKSEPFSEVFFNSSIETKSSDDDWDDNRRRRMPIFYCLSVCFSASVCYQPLKGMIEFLFKLEPLKLNDLKSRKFSLFVSGKQWKRKLKQIAIYFCNLFHKLIASTGKRNNWELSQELKEDMF